MKRTHTQVVVIPVFPLAALFHMHEAEAMCEAAHCQAGLNGQGRGGRESCVPASPPQHYACQPERQQLSPYLYKYAHK